MKEKVEDILYRSTVRIFEDIAFMLPNMELNEQQMGASVEVAVAVDFCGPFNGKLVVRISNSLLPILAANMLGEGEPPCRSEQLDALREVANIICGNLLPALTGTKEVFRLSAPSLISSREPLDHPNDIPVAEARIGIDEGRVEVVLFIEDKEVDR